ncbi:MAG: nucleotidyltransferase family protein [Clostridia bacterium]|nr:nucleotidyltransferase family protein [Clostridia bacterium]
MKLMAVICEYNPFHNGHAYQLQKQKEALGCDGVICLMSGSFVQRGEPAVFDKWARSEMALSSGCDLVLELPVVYSLQSAEGFATGGVSLLSKLGYEGYLCFGSESGDIAMLREVSKISQMPAFQRGVKAHLETGISYPKACAMALAGIVKTPLMPNDMLGVEYIKAIDKLGAKVVPAAIQREQGMHDALTPDGAFLSATGIRSRLYGGKDVSSFVPPVVAEIINREIAAGRGPVTAEDLGILLCYALRRADAATLVKISGVSEGLENRLIAAAEEFRSFDEIAMVAKTKRYPYTRICRTLLKVLLGITKDDESLKPAYARILGVGKGGGAVLKQLQKTTTVPILNKLATADFADANARRLFSLDVAATDLYALLYPKKNTGKSGMDFYRSPVILIND